MISIRKRGMYINININLLLHLLMVKENIKTSHDLKPNQKLLRQEYINVGHCIESSKISYSNYLDYWMKEYFELNYKYSTAKRYKESFRNIKKELGNYKLSILTPYVLNQALLKL